MFGKHTRGPINFIFTSSAKIKKSINYWLIFTTLSTLLSFVIIKIIYSYENKRYEKFKKRYSLIEQEYNKLNNIKEKKKELINKLQKFSKNNSILKNNIDTIKNLIIKISQAIPHDSRLELFSYNFNEKVKLEGKALSWNSIFQFLFSLSNYNFKSRPQLVKSYQIKNSNQIFFEIKINKI